MTPQPPLPYADLTALRATIAEALRTVEHVIVTETRGPDRHLDSERVAALAATLREFCQGVPEEQMVTAPAEALDAFTSLVTLTLHLEAWGWINTWAAKVVGVGGSESAVTAVLRGHLIGIRESMGDAWGRLRAWEGE